MSDQTLTQRLEALPSEGVDYTDPNTYAELLGYKDEPAAAPAPAAPQGDTAPAPAAAAPAAAPAPAESNPAPAVASQTEAPVAGVLTKDGKHVMPFTVVQDLRTRNSQLAEQLAEATRRLEEEAAARAAGTSTQESQAQAQAAALQFTEEELADLQAIPAAAKLVQGFQALQAKLDQVVSAAAPAPAPAPTAQATGMSVQDAIDQNPLLTRWQAKGGALWDEAVALDQQLRADPQWAGKSMADRFAEVQTRIANEYGIAIPQSTPSGAPAPATTPPGPTPAPASAAREVMPTLTDFGGAAVATGDPMNGMTVGQMVDKVSSMSVEDVRRMVGLSY